MAISLELITLPEEADSLLKTAQRDKRIFEHRKESIDLRTATSAENAIELQQDLTASQAELTTAIAIIASLPEGSKKEEEITKKLSLELKIRKLTESGNKSGALALIEKEYDADLLDRQLAGIETFMDAVLARKAAL
jgi:hypothetical protein